jgi:hypothetical protein
LMAWEPLPSIPYTGTTMGTKDADGRDLPMPNVFPILLRAESNEGAIINPGDFAVFRVFNMIRTGTYTVEIAGKERQFRWFKPMMNQRHAFDVQVSTTSSTMTHRFQLRFVPGENDIAAFEVEKMEDR